MPYCFGFFQFRLGHDGVTSSVKSSPLARLLQVGPHYVDEFFSCFHLRSILARLRVEDVESDMTLQHFRHQAVQGTTTGGHGLKYAGTFVLTVERPFDSFDMSPNPLDANVSVCLRHWFCPLSYNILL